MKNALKIVLTIPQLILVYYFLSHWILKDLIWFDTNSAYYDVLMYSLFGFNVIAMIILIYRVLSFKNIIKPIKSEWVWILIIFYIPVSLYYIWQKDSELEIVNDDW
ncbi:MAG: hypothetical protein KJO41_05700 [Bacteroidia bacterium]|nr:hypothetical protein [Bacteroidia bacterium]MBT8278477.1 hypothetical protein [Bacteroidia bacterium]NND26355.1 hypothetical protein [Flavobacteriaceae bacterium]NNK59133.1 hypothetical protein [Flavobacteriaceae bacterium]NNL31705.1 hypothetical protein [Flavobacteriaceae bacterium]